MACGVPSRSMKRGTEVNKLYIIVASAAALSLSACTTTRPAYQATTGGQGTGYFSERVGTDRYTVGYRGNKAMSAAQVAEYALLRAAELTVENGQQWFAVLHTDTREVDANTSTDLSARGGPVLSTGTTGAGAGGGARPGGASPGVSDGYVPGGPTTGGFGGGDVPYQVLERWRQSAVQQTTVVIQMGSGKAASFDGLNKAPEIYAAAEVAEKIRAKLAN